MSLAAAPAFLAPGVDGGRSFGLLYVRDGECGIHLGVPGTCRGGGGTKTKTKRRKKKGGRTQTGREQRERESSINEQVQGRGGQVELREDRPGRQTCHVTARPHFCQARRVHSRAEMNVLILHRFHIGFGDSHGHK